MCRPETKQTYIALKAFNRAGKHLYMDELKNEISAILKPLDLSGSIEDLGPLSLREILNELAHGMMTRPDKDMRRTLTSDGLLLKKSLGGYVQEASPQLIAA